MSTTSRNADGATARFRSAHGAALGFCALLLAIYAGTSWLAWQSKGLTWDEPLHFVGAAIQVRDSDFAYDAENPPMWKYYFALGNPTIKQMKLDEPAGGWSAISGAPRAMQDYATRAVYQTPANDARTLMQSARARMLFLAMLLGAIIAWWAWRLAGPVAACVSCALFCLDPNFLAHGLLIKNDVPIAMLFTALTAAIWSVGRSAGILNVVTAGLLLGASLTTKYSGLLEIPVLGVLLLARALIPTDWPILMFTARGLGRRIVAAAVIGLCVILICWGLIWGCYGFRYLSPEDDLSDMNPAILHYAAGRMMVDHDVDRDTPPEQIRQWLSEWQIDPTVRFVLWADAHHLFPHEFLRGFLFATGDSFGRAAFLMGDVRVRGWWYYFPLAMLFKTPLAVLVAIPLAAILWFFLPTRPDPWAICGMAIAPIIYMASAMHSNLNVGIRHIFPVYPFLYIVLGITAGRAVVRFGKPAVAILAIMLIGLAAETFAAFPDYIPFFNVACGGARLLGDSNIDWGQELPAIAAWQRSHPEYQLMLYYFAEADPRFYGIRYANLPASSAPADQTHATGQRPYWVISVVALQGQSLTARGRTFYQPFQHRQPTQIIGGCMYMYAPW